MDTYHIIFVINMTIAMLIFLIGVYINVIKKLREIYKLWGNYFDLKKFSTRALWNMLRKEVILQLQLKSENKLRWLRHVLICWGFITLFIFSAFAALYNLLGANIPIINLLLQFAMELTGAFLLIGLILALIRAVLVRNTRQNIYSYTKVTILLFSIISTGYLLEAIRYAGGGYQFSSYEFFGSTIAMVIKPLDLPWDTLHKILWQVHALLVAVFFAFLPFSKLVHIIAVPTGLLMRSQDSILEGRLLSVVKGLLNEGNLPFDNKD